MEDLVDTEEKFILSSDCGSDNDEVQHFLKAHIDVLFCYEISRTKHELPDKIMCKIVRKNKGITFHLAD